MSRVLLAGVALALGLGACASGPGRRYANSDLVILTAYTAKDACSCVFVMRQSEEHCRAWTRNTPDVGSFEVNHEKKTVESSALLFWGAKARFAGQKQGCVLEE